MTANIGQWLAGSLSPDQNVREEATRKLDQASKDNLAEYMGMLTQELLNAQTPPEVRSAAALALKNSLTAREQARKEELYNRWYQIDERLRTQIKQAILSALGTQVGSQASQALAAIAGADLPKGLWPDLMQSLLRNVTEPQSTEDLKSYSLMTIGYICEVIEPQILESQSDAILTAVINGARKDEPSQKVRRQALNALYNSLEFVRANFERDGERNFIMQVVCEGTQSTDSECQVAAFQCLVRIVSLYYSHMEMYMKKALFGLTIFGMQSEDERVVLQAIEFWSTVAEVEIDLQIEKSDAEDMEKAFVKPLFYFSQAVLKDIVPVLTWLMTKQEEDTDEDEWNPAMAAATCLSLLAQCTGDAITPHCLTFIDQNLRHSDWHFRDAAVMTFGSILEGPDQQRLGQLVGQAFQYLLGMMSDPHPVVKDTTAWCLGRVCDLVMTMVPPANHPPLVTALLTGLNDNPRIASNCCWALMNFAENVYNASFDDPSYTTTPYFETVAGELLRISTRADNEAKIRTSAYEALSAFVSAAENDTIPLVQRITEEVLNRLEQSLAQANQIVSRDDRAALSELQSNLCAVLTTCIRKLDRDIAPASDRTMMVLLQILQNAGKQSTVLEDAFIAVGALITVIEDNFKRYIDSFIPFLFSALQNHEEHQLCSIAVGLIGDICRALNADVAPYVETFMNTLFANLQSATLHKDVKPTVLAAFGDIALAIGSRFEPYLPHVVAILEQANATEGPLNNAEFVDYLTRLREGILEAWVSIVQGFLADQKGDVLYPYLEKPFKCIYETVNLGDLTEASCSAACGLLGDLVEMFGPTVKNTVTQPWVEQFLNRVIKGRLFEAKTRETAKYARQQINNLP
ncbi:karyopherin Kap95 [Sorochytrium milnesiophthora]